MKYFLFVMGLCLLGCVHQSIHDYCTVHESEYKSYDECYSEVKEERQQKNERRKAYLQRSNITINNKTQ